MNPLSAPLKNSHVHLVTRVQQHGVAYRRPSLSDAGGTAADLVFLGRAVLQRHERQRRGGGHNDKDGLYPPLYHLFLEGISLCVCVLRTRQYACLNVLCLLCFLFLLSWKLVLNLFLNNHYFFCNNQHFMSQLVTTNTIKIFEKSKSSLIYI